MRVKEIVAAISPKPAAESTIRRKPVGSREESAEIAPPPEEVITEKQREGTGRESREGSRYISSAVRERVLQRACYRCEYTGPGGVRCSARTWLEIDHIHPWAKGGGTGDENLRVLCRAHNLLWAAREFGEEFMREKIEAGTEDQSGRLKEEQPRANFRGEAEALCIVKKTRRPPPNG